MPREPRPIIFVSDFGLSNEWVGICHAVMSRIAPQSRIVDLSHLVPALNVLSGALLLADSLPYIAENAVVLAVVDPGADPVRSARLQPLRKPDAQRARGRPRRRQAGRA